MAKANNNQESHRTNPHRSSLFHKVAQLVLDAVFKIIVL